MTASSSPTVPLLRATLEAGRAQLHPMSDIATVHLDHAYDNTPCRDLLDELAFDADIAPKAFRQRPRSANGG